MHAMENQYQVGTIRRDGFLGERFDALGGAIDRFYDAFGDPDVVASAIYDSRGQMIATWSPAEGVMRSSPHPDAKYVSGPDAGGSECANGQ